MGVEYPGEVEVIVELDPGNIVCSDVTTEDTSCTAVLLASLMMMSTLSVLL